MPTIIAMVVACFQLLAAASAAKTFAELPKNDAF
jgi:hypothetical protein